MSTQITWNGHSNFFIESDGSKVLIDPFFCDTELLEMYLNGERKPDIVLVTHDHGDHLGAAVDICQKTGAKLGAIVETAAKLQGLGIAAEQIINGIGFNFGGTVSENNVQITMVPAQHSSESSLPAGFILVMSDNTTIYHAGDTGIFTDMQLWGDIYSIDVALLPIGGVFTMDSKQAAYACKLLKAKNVIPMHWGTFPILEQNTEKFAENLKEYAPTCKFIEIKIGETKALS